MANIKSQIKRNRQNEKRRVRNKGVRSELRTSIKKAEASAGGEDEVETMRKAMKSIDKAANKGVMHKKAASRQKSRLAKRIAKASA